MPKIVLPSGPYADKKILIRSNAGYPAEVSSKGQQWNNSTMVSQGSVTPFTFYAGLWISPADVAQSRFVYGHDFWTARLPAGWVKPGLSLQFASGNLTSTLTGLDIGAPSELLMHTIDLGMLTPPRDAFDFAKSPATGAHYEYFQTLPVSRMVVGNYESVHFKEVMLPDGRLLTTNDPSVGGWHEGVMRESIGKLLVSHGINNANYGMWSSSSTNESSHPFAVAQLTAHNSVGMYSNGRQVHGGSGGSGMVTLDSSIGNELSHEVGHNFGLGHFEGSAKGSIHRPAHDVNSTWGWDARSNVFLPNFGGDKNNKPTCWTVDTSSQDCVPAFAGFSFGFDSMAGGEPLSPQVNRFTMYSPYTMKIIQQFFESRAVFAKASPTGFAKWNAQTRQMDAFEWRVPNLDEVAASPEDAANTAFFAQQYARGAHLVSVNMGDGYWGPTIAPPVASAANAGRLIEIKHQASYGSTLVLNGRNIPIAYGANKLYQSNGSTWNEITQINRTVAKKPQQFGVPVTTLVGYYDPESSLASYVYPALHGGYGFTYADDSGTASPCQLQVQTNAGLRRYRLSSVRIDKGLMNKFHVNLPASAGASSATVVCRGVTLASRALQPRQAKVGYTVNGVPLN